MENEAGYGRKGVDYNSSLERHIKGWVMLFVSEYRWQGSGMGTKGMGEKWGFGLLTTGRGGRAALGSPG